MIRNNNSCAISLLLTCLGIALSGCSGPPSASDGRQAVEDQIKRDSGGRIRLVHFEKTNGQSAEVMGVKVYTFEYEAEIEFLEACKWSIATIAGTIADDNTPFRTTKSPDKTLGELAQFTEATQNPGTEAQKGQRVKLAGSIRYEKKEKGWWVDRVNVTSFTAAAASANSSPPAATTKAESADPVAKFNLQMDDLNTWVGTAGDRIRDKSSALAVLQETFTRAQKLDTRRLPVDFATAWTNFIGLQSELLSTATSSEGQDKLRFLRDRVQKAGTDVEDLSTRYGLRTLEIDKPRRPTATGSTDERLIKAARLLIANVKTALDAYEVDNGFYPKGKDGLKDLIQKPHEAQHWYGPYMSSIPMDPWGNYLLYECPGRRNPSSFDLTCLGPDGQAGTTDDITH